MPLKILENKNIIKEKIDMINFGWATKVEKKSLNCNVIMRKQLKWNVGVTLRAMRDSFRLINI